MNWPKELKVKTDYPLKDRNTFKIGGRARFFCEPEDAGKLALLIRLAKKNKIPVYILGAGSNLLISDEGVGGLVIKLSSSYFKKISREDELIKVAGGAMLGGLIKFAKSKSLQGAEFLTGIPGTAGGALAMNAGCWGQDIGGLVVQAQVMNKSGEIKTLSRKEIKFSYRKSSLSKYIILGALLRLKKGSASEIKNNINKFLASRRKTQGLLTSPNAGCIFKNPKNNSAGMLLDLCGLKGKHIGGAFISERHANFILNKNRASAADVLRLMRMVKQRVKSKFHLTLQPEIKIWE
jgi:UDP-N-acetylmuramate dehydrogenase